MSNNIPPLLQYIITAIVSTCSLIVAAISVMVVWRVNTTSQKSTNAWEVYKQYTSEEIKQARITVRTLMEDPKWKTVTDYRSYCTYFQLDSPTGLEPDKEPQKQQEPKVKNERKKQELEVHSLLAFYHQVGLLLERKLLPEDFTMQLLGGGLEDRWKFLAPIPQFYPHHPYTGMYQLHERYLRWKGHVPVESLASPLRTPLGDNTLHYREGAEV